MLRKIALNAITACPGRSILRSGALLAVLGGAALASQACSPADSRAVMGSGGNTAQGGASSANGGQVGAGGSTANGGAPSGGSSNGGSSNGGSSNGGSGQGGAPNAGGSSNGGSSNGGGSNGGSSNATGGRSQGGATAGGTTANGGSASGGAAGTAGGAQGGSGNAGGAAAGCPANATWCSSFEEDKLPTGAVYKLNGDPATPWTHDFEVDSTVSKVGRSSLLVKNVSTASGAYKMLAVNSGGSAFWVRFYLRSDVELGASAHNVYAQAAGSDDPNDANSVEFAEDVGLAFNSHDDVRWPSGYGRTSGGGVKPFTLPKDTWHCIEISFDGPGKQQKLFINGTQQIDATSFPATAYTFKTFRFGYNSLNGTARKLWYDDVVVAPARVNCL
jgi:hypothetical protein